MKRLEQLLSENMTRYRVKNLNEADQMDIQFNSTPDTDIKKMDMLIRQMFQGKTEQEIEAYIKTKPPGWWKKIMRALKNMGIKGKDGEKHGGPVIGLAGIVGTILSFLEKPKNEGFEKKTTVTEQDPKTMVDTPMSRTIFTIDELEPYFTKIGFKKVKPLIGKSKLVKKCGNLKVVIHSKLDGYHVNFAIETEIERMSGPTASSYFQNRILIRPDSSNDIEKAVKLIQDQTTQKLAGEQDTIEGCPGIFK